ncbi:MAG: MBL fold metallo-hydrolase [Spirochaetes bacterium]|nr:MBL fold metallo-hydrolase [Spirochaetota bacterium]
MRRTGRVRAAVRTAVFLVFIIHAADSDMLFGDDGLRLTVVYDNNEYDPSLKTAWGFSCLIEGAQKTILFDTGGDGDVLIHNMKLLGIDPGTIDAVVLSHTHHDHTGGLQRLLKEHGDMEVWVGDWFPESIRNMARACGAEVVTVGGPSALCEGVFTTGGMGKEIREQALFFCTAEGTVIVTGCAHPGILEVIDTAKRLASEDCDSAEVFFVIGGFHLSGASERVLHRIVNGFQSRGVVKAAPCHCSGGACRAMFRAVYGERFIPAGAGTRIVLRPSRP